MSNPYSVEFWEFMKNRMMVSQAKYGDPKDAYPHKVDAISSMEVRVQRYHETGNTEWLVDAANFLMLEFMFPRHPSAHFRATDSNESPGRETHEGTNTKDNSSLDQGR